MAVGDHRPQRRHDGLDELDALLLAVILHDGLEPFVVGAVDGDLAGPFLVLGKLLVALRQLRGLDLLGVVGRRIVVGVDAVPALVRIAGIRGDVAGLGRLVGRQHLQRHLVDGRGLHDVVGFLIGAKLDRHARHQDRVGCAHIFDLDAGRVGEQFEQRQAFLLVGRRVDDERALRPGRRQQRGIEPRSRRFRAGRCALGLGRRAAERRDERKDEPEQSGRQSAVR